MAIQAQSRGLPLSHLLMAPASLIEATRSSNEVVIDEILLH